MNIIEAPWNGYVTPRENIIRPNSDYAKISHKATKLINQVYKELSKDGRKTYDEVCYMQASLSNISECDNFIQGFRLGAKIMLDIMGSYESQLPQIGSFYRS